MRRVVIVRQGTKYGPEWETLIGRMVSEHAEGARSLICISDQPGPCNVRIPIRRNWPGWWSKLEVFAPWNRFFRPCLFLDLDTYLFDDIQDLLAESDKFMMLRDFNQPDCGQSSVMLVPKDTDHIWEEFERDPEGHISTFRVTGDQGFLNQFNEGFLQDHFDGIKSYKKHCRVAPLGRIVCFHGKPKPPEIEGWALDVWNEYTESG